MTYLQFDEKYEDINISTQLFEEYLNEEYFLDKISLSNLAESLEKYQEEFSNKKDHFDVIAPLVENRINIITSDKHKLNEKLSEDNNLIKKRFYCPTIGCGKSYSMHKVLQTHIKNHTEVKLYRCDYSNCGKVYKSKENLNLHVKNKHLGVKPYKCIYCDSYFTHRNGKTYHERRIHSNYFPYNCEFEKCDKSFASKSSLNYHKKNKH